MTGRPTNAKPSEPPPREGPSVPARQDPSAAGDRYSRQERFTPLGPEGQCRIRGGSALVVGVGALGTHLADTLARSGIRRLILVDRDIVEHSNLQRQVLFTEADAEARLPKVQAARTQLRKVRSDLEIEALADEFDGRLFTALGETPDVILDGTDNYPTRFLINDLAVREGIPWIYGGAVGSQGSGAVILPGESPCLRCLLPSGPAPGAADTCETAGVLGTAVAMTAAFQATEALKILSGHRSDCARGVFQHDVWNSSAGYRLSHASRDPRCQTCGTREFPELARGPMQTATLCGRDAVQIHPREGAHCDLDELATANAAAVEELERTPHLLRFRVDGARFTVFPGGRALIFGCSDENRARALYDRWVGGS